MTLSSFKRIVDTTLENVFCLLKRQPKDIFLPFVDHGGLQLLEPLAGNLVADHR